MPLPSALSSAPRVARVTVQLPATGGTAAKLEDLVVAALNAREAGLGDLEKPYIMGGRILKTSAAYVAGDSTSDLPVSIAVSEIYEEPSVDFLKLTYAKAAGSAFNVVISVYLARR